MAADEGAHTGAVDGADPPQVGNQVPAAGPEEIVNEALVLLRPAAGNERLLWRHQYLAPRCALPHARFLALVCWFVNPAPAFLG